MKIKKISLINTFSSVNNELKQIINHHKKPSYYKIEAIKNNNNINKLIQESKSILSSDHTNSGITLDQTKINYIKPNLKKQNFNFLNSKEHRNFMKIFNYNITRSISKNKNDKKTTLQKDSLKHSMEIKKRVCKRSNIKANNVKNIHLVKENKINYKSPIKVLNNSKSTIIINNKTSEKNLSHNSSLISDTSIFNSKPSISITSTISFSKKESVNNSKIENKKDDIQMTYSEEENTTRNIKKEGNNGFQKFYERINKKLFGC